MSGQITRKPRAPRDLADLATYIGSPWESDHRRCRDLRCWPVRGFPNHLVFYRPVRGGIDLIRVLHAARDLERLLTK
jgi:toxin ParE1/3/4